MSGNVNNNGVLMGNRGGQQPGMGGQPQQQQGQSQQASMSNNYLAALASHGQRFSPSLSQKSGMSSLYSYGNARTNYAALLGIEETISEEQVKIQAIQEAGVIAQSLVNICVHRKTNNPFYATWRAALDRFKHPSKNLPQEPAYIDFINMIDSEQNLHHFILYQVGVQAGAEITNHFVNGDESLRQDRSKIQEIWYRCCVDTINLQFADYLVTSPNGAQIYYRMSNIAKELIGKLEPQIFDLVMQRYTYVNIACPYRKGNIASLIERSSIDNPLLAVHNPLEMGLGGNIFDTNANIFGTHLESNDAKAANELTAFIMQKASGHSMNVPVQQDHPEAIQTLYTDYDRPELRLENMTRENRHQYSMDKYVSNIPGTDWYLMRDENAKYILRNLVKDDGTNFNWSDTRCLGTVPIYRLNWQEGTFNFRLVKHNLQAWDLMGTLLSNPEKLLPFMYEEDGVQKTTFDPTVMETSKFVRDNVVVPLGEMKELEKEPNILIGNRPIKANQGNEAIVKRLNVLTETYDPKGKLDAFALPVVSMRDWIMDTSVNMDEFYTNFRIMVQGNKNEISDTSRVFRAISNSVMECPSEDWNEFVTNYLTNLTNRWLIECRGYIETKEEALQIPGSKYLRISNIFTDLDALIIHLREHDPATLRAFMDYQSNDFLRSGIEIIAPAEEVKAEYEDRYKSEEDPAVRAALIKSGERTVMFRRDCLMINLVKQVGPHSPQLTVIKQSGNPELFAIVNKASNVVAKHFDGTSQVLIKFNKDEGNKIWVATRSDFDMDNVFVLRCISEVQEFCHPYPICE